MSRGRETRHMARVLACVALMAVSAGCRSPFQRLADGTSPEPYSAGARPEMPPLQPVPEAGPATMVVPAAQKATDIAPIAGPVAPVPTPLLDAALKHAATIEQAHRQATTAQSSSSSTATASHSDAPVNASAARNTKSTLEDKEPVRSFKLAAGQAPGMATR